MNRSRVLQAAGLLAAVLLLTLTACGDRLSGLYGDKGGVNLEFHANGKVTLDVIGPLQEATYVVEDGQVKISSPGAGTLVLKIDDKGCLDGGAFLGRLCKR